MSRPARWVLGSFAFLFAVVFATAVNNSPEPFFIWACAGFCLLISLACFSSVARTPALRVIGATVFGIYAAGAAAAAAKLSRLPFDGHLHWSWVTQIQGPLEGLITFGLPGLYVAISGRFPLWSKLAPAFLQGKYREDAELDRQLDKLT
ncbi:MAG TPA: hypothetical protein VMI32_04495 [Candidatus Solibacter sp.]|nr:hypothetical protein [Candidatus Solibacter sp.]